MEVDPAYYTVSYINNVNKGSATILINGDEEHTAGSRMAKFGITNMSMERFNQIQK